MPQENEPNKPVSGAAPSGEKQAPSAQTVTAGEAKKPEETLADTDVSMDDFIAAANTVATKIVTPAKKEEPKVELAAKPPVDKPVDKPVEKPQDKPVDKPVDKQPDTTDQTDKRDYNDLPPELQPVFKKLHNEPFNTFKPIVKELAESKKKLAENEAKIKKLQEGALPESYFEHPRGYTLTPEFEVAANTAIKADQIYQAWKQQYERIRKGEATYQEIDLDPRTGQIVYSKPVQVTADSEKEVAPLVEWAQRQAMERGLAVKQLGEQHNTRYKDAVTQIQQFENDSFKQFKPEEKEAWKAVIDDTINNVFPPAFRNNPMAVGYAKALITIQQLGGLLKKFQENGGKIDQIQKTEDGKVINLADAKKAGPNDSAITASATSGNRNGNEDVTMDDFRAAKATR